MALALLAVLLLMTAVAITFRLVVATGPRFLTDPPEALEAELADAAAAVSAVGAKR
jgi:hypothetical protein